MLKQINIIHYERGMSWKQIQEYDECMLVMTTGWKMDCKVDYIGDPNNTVIIKDTENN